MRLPPTQPAIRAIQSEHDSLAAVIRAMGQLADAIGKGKKLPELKVFRAMLVYIADYPEKVHHPKEDRYLFALVRRRTESINPILATLESQHALGERLIRDMEHALNQYELQGPDAMMPFVDLVTKYCDFYVDHMRLEEQIVLPVTLEFYTAEDWNTVNLAFAENEDAPVGPLHKREFDKLFSLIANTTPAPIGLGPELR